MPLFHRVKQRPGKPLFFGKLKNKAVFGLPGNPSSVLTCFYEYVLDAIALMSGKKELLKKQTATLSTSWKKAAGLTHFLKGQMHGTVVDILDAQESYRMSSFAIADCLIVLPEEDTHFIKGETVDIHLIP
jgi:molybdopterin molybdotransferase